jgi:toxin ParE1/3/4
MDVRWTEPASLDFTQICDYLQEHEGPAMARRVALSIYERVQSLRRFPNRGRPGRKANTRELVLTALPYLAIYRVRDDAIEILRILHGARVWPV